MFERFKEYVKYGAGRPPGTMWAMERAFFEYMYRYPDRNEYAYIRLALQARYPERADIPAITERCSGLDDAIVAAVELDFGREAAILFRPALQSFPPCSHCGQFRALSSKDSFCYGCRTYGRMLVCRVCRLYWDREASFCQKCGSELSPTFARADRATIHVADAAAPAPYREKHLGIATNSCTVLPPRFDFSQEELAAFGTTFFLVGRWRDLVETEKEAADWVLGITRNVTQQTSSDRDAVQSLFFPLQMLLMARRSSDFCSVQNEPAFSTSGHRNFRRLHHAFRRAGESGFADQWRRIFPGEGELSVPQNQIISYRGGSGDSKDTAILLSTSEPPLMVSAEHWYLSYQFGRQNQQWSKAMQALLRRDQNGKMYDVIEIDLTDGARKSVYFDISSLPY